MSPTQCEIRDWQLEQARMVLGEYVKDHEYDQARPCAHFILELIDKLQELESTQSQEVAP